MGKVQFVLNGKEAIAGGPGHRTQQVIDFVRSIPDGKYFNIQGVADCIKATRRAVEHALRNVGDDLDGHFMRVPTGVGGSGQSVYGSKKGIAALKKKLQDSDLI